MKLSERKFTHPWTEHNEKLMGQLRKSALYIHYNNYNTDNILFTATILIKLTLGWRVQVWRAGTPDGYRYSAVPNSCTRTRTHGCTCSKTHGLTRTCVIHYTHWNVLASSGIFIAHLQGQPRTCRRSCCVMEGSQAHTGMSLHLPGCSVHIYRAAQQVLLCYGRITSTHWNVLASSGMFIAHSGMSWMILGYLQ